MKNFSAALLLLLSFSLVSQELSKQQVLTFPISNELIDREHQTEKSQAGATSARIIASVNFKKSGNTLIPADSTCYIWLGNHTSIQDKTHGGANTIAADSTITYQYSNGTYAIKQRKIRDYGIANRDFYLWQNWNTTSWVNYARQRIYYNTDGNQTDFINELWNSNTSAWDSSEYWSHQYNGKNLIDNAYKSWSGGNIYNWTHSSYQFNGNNLTDEVFQTWNSTVKKLMNNSHTTYQYIANNKTGSTIQFWNIKNNNWQNSSRSEYFYSLNTLTYSLGYTWDSVNTVWNKTDSTVYKSNGTNIIDELHYSLSKSTQTLVKERRISNTYTGTNRTEYRDTLWDNANVVRLGTLLSDQFDVQGNHTDNVYKKWNTTDKTYRNESHTSWSYTNSLETDNVQQGWDTLNKVWADAIRYTHRWDNFGNLVEYVTLAPLGSGNWMNYTRSLWATDTAGNYNQLKNEDWNGSSWVPSSTSTPQLNIYYETFTSNGIESNKKETISINPNPFDSHIFIHNPQGLPLHISICNLLGQTIKSENTSLMNAAVETSELIAGAYFLLVTDSNGKIVLRNSVVKH